MYYILSHQLSYLSIETLSLSKIYIQDISAEYVLGM